MLSVGTYDVKVFSSPSVASYSSFSLFSCFLIFCCSVQLFDFLLFCSIFISFGLWFIAGADSSKTNPYDANHSLSSDEELFQECEDPDTTQVVVNSTTVPGHSSNIDHKEFDKTINFSNITSNSTAGVSIVSESSHIHERSDILFKTNDADRTIQGDITGLESSGNQSNDKGLEVPSVESFATTSVETPEDRPASVTQHLNNTAEELNDEVEEAQEVEEVPKAEEVSKEDEMPKAEHTPKSGETLKSEETPKPEESAKPEEKPIGDQVNSPAVEEANKNGDLNPAQSVDQTITTTPEMNSGRRNSTMKHSDTISSPFLDMSTEPKPITSFEVSSSSQHAEENNTNHSLGNSNLSPGLHGNENDAQSPLNETISKPVDSKPLDVTINVMADLSNKSSQINAAEEEKSANQANEETKTNEELEVQAFMPNPSAANQSFEAMEVDMNETVDHQEETQTPSQFGTVTEAPLNQTVEMADPDQTDEIAQPALDVTVNVSSEPIEPNATFAQPASPSDTFEMAQPKNAEALNVTQNFSEFAKPKLNLNQTVDLASSKNAISPIPVAKVNDAFMKNVSPFNLNQTHNLSKDFLSSTFDGATKPASPVTKSNLNETIVVENKLPAVDTSFVVSPKSEEMQPKQEGGAFKMPAKPSNATNPFSSKPQAQNQSEEFDDEFQSPGRKSYFRFPFVFCSLFSYFLFFSLNLSFLLFRYGSLNNNVFDKWYATLRAYRLLSDIPAS